MGLEFGRDICGDLHCSEAREWLVTNGIGGYASGTVAGLLTRRYHGLLVAALKPPLGRTLLVTKVDEIADYDGQTYALATNRWIDGSLDPQGYQYIERFSLEGTVPTWDFAFSDALLSKRVWMQQGSNTTYLQYSLRRATQPLKLRLKVFVNYRDYHGNTWGHTWQMAVEPVPQGVRVTAFPGATPFYLLSDTAGVTLDHTSYDNFDLAIERYRGLGDRENHLHVASFDVILHTQDSLTLVATTEAATSLNSQVALQDRQAYEQRLLTLWQHQGQPHPEMSQPPPAWIQQLVLAADQFIADRPTPQEPLGKTVIAGYPWFSDWGRDTMVSLPGLTLVTGRPEIARAILKTFARSVDQGMLPNRFPDAGDTPEFNTVDATLWYFEAIRAYVTATHDLDLLQELFPVLADIIDWHLRGTRYNIHVDPADGLLYAGEAGVQLTWMDAKVGNWVVTPRTGKPIEVNALWYNALRAIAQMARQLGQPAQEYDALANQVLARFGRFWNCELGYCYDVLDTPTGNDASLRPNQILAVSLADSPLAPDQQRAIVEICGRKLLTSHGLRSLNPNHPQYQGHYGGNQTLRDGAYHQGTVWGWLLGPYALAHFRVYGDPEQAAQFLQPMAQHLQAHGVGSLSEIFDGDAPMIPRGCFAQAWTVAEVLRAWQILHSSAG
jgi:predicted glycogen debranching enzyme